MTGLYVLIVISILVSITAVVLVILSMKKKTNSKAVTVDDIKVENSLLQKNIESSVQVNASALKGAITAQADNAKYQSQRFDTFMINMDNKFDKLKDDNNRNLEAVRKDNADQLEKMRLTVDEKLNDTLNKRFNESFKLVEERLDTMTKSFAELQTLQNGVTDLNKLFNNVKTRGTWGEIQLENLLSQILSKDQFQKQVKLQKNSSDMVDFAIVLPGKDKDSGSIFLPIDSKFPTQDYLRLQEAYDKGNMDDIKTAIKGLVAAVKAQAKSINEKYIIEPITTNYAVMYLPSEGLYAEVIKTDGLIEELQNKYSVVVCGPTTIAALLNSFQLGFRNYAMEKKSNEIARTLNQFRTDFGKFTDLLGKTVKQIDTVKDTIEDAQKRTSLIQKRLNDVGSIAGNTSFDVKSNDVEMEPQLFIK